MKIKSLFSILREMHNNVVNYLQHFRRGILKLSFVCNKKKCVSVCNVKLE